MTLEFGHVTFDCADAATLAGFWSAVTGWPVDDGASPYFATVGRAAGAPVVLMFIQVPEPKSTKNRVHIDWHAAHWRDEVDRVVSLGATHVADFDEYGTTWATLRDPEGNEFDIGAG